MNVTKLMYAGGRSTGMDTVRKGLHKYARVALLSLTV